MNLKNANGASIPLLPTDYYQVKYEAKTNAGASREICNTNVRLLLI